MDVILKMVDEKKGVTPVAACDVWDGDPTKGRGKGQGLFPSAKRLGLNTEDKTHVSKDYRRILAAVKRLYLLGKNDRPTGTFTFAELLAHELAVEQAGRVSGS